MVRSDHGKVAKHGKSDQNNSDQSMCCEEECKLGINSNTGRLQWCPANPCVRFMVLIPVILLPILLICIVLTNLNVIQILRSHSTDDYSTTEQLGEPQLKNCQAVRFRTSEILESEERDLLRDIRTSFIPTTPIYVPPNCIEDEGETPVTEIVGGQESTIVHLFSYLVRRRRGSEQNDTESVSEPPEFTTFINNSTLQTEEDTSSTPSPPTTTTKSNDQVVPEFTSFWKGEGSPASVRETQSMMMAKYMDTTMDPCTDFYQYACGNWESLNPISKDRAAFDTFEMLRESLDIVLQELLENGTTAKNPESLIEIMKEPTAAPLIEFEINDDNWSSDDDQKQSNTIRKRKTRKRRQTSKQNDEMADDAETKAIHLYRSCMDYSLLEKRGIKPLLDLLQSLGGWPLLDENWSEEKFDWLVLTAKLRLFNNDIFIVEWVGPDIKNSEENIIQFDQTSLGLPTRDYFLQNSNHDYLQAYREYMGSVIHLLGVSEAESISVSAELVDFETELAKITQMPEERTNISLLYRRITIQELHTLIPEIAWVKYLEIVLQREVEQSEKVVMFATNFMQDLVKLLEKTEKRVIANYLLWRFVRHRVNNLDDRFQDAKQRFYFVLFGREQSPPRWKTCVNQVNSNMGMALGAMFVRRYFDEFSKRDTLTMTHDLQESFREILNSTEWIDDLTKNLAEEKVNAMSLKIGYPDYILIKNELNEKYKDLEIHPEKYFENTLNVLKHMTRYEHDKLTEIVNKTVWHTAPAVVNAYYSRNKNQIMFPAGILQPPFYHRHFPKSLNYGGIGVVIGHELTHGFDDKGRLFDQNGNLLRWWSDSAISNFHERARCLILQYGNYTVADVGLAIDGANTQGENIADNGGVKQAFRAYKKWFEAQENPESEELPGLNATNTQLFFLNFAQIWCGAMRPEATKNKLKTAVHSPGRFRVIGTLSNSDDFAREFNCPPGTPMNPVQKCTVW